MLHCTKANAASGSSALDCTLCRSQTETRSSAGLSSGRNLSSTSSRLLCKLLAQHLLRSSRSQRTSTNRTEQRRNGLSHARGKQRRIGKVFAQTSLNTGEEAFLVRSSDAYVRLLLTGAQTLRLYALTIVSNRLCKIANSGLKVSGRQTVQLSRELQQLANARDDRASSIAQETGLAAAFRRSWCSLRRRRISDVGFGVG